MARWLFLGLIIVNVFYFVWTQQDVFVSDDKLQDELLADDHQLRLLNEISVADSAGHMDGEREHILLLGGLPAKSDIQALQQRLISLDINSQVTERLDTAALGYQVYLEPVSSGVSTAKVLKELQGLQLEGVVLPEGESSAVIQLGEYDDRGYAQGIVENIRDAGYVALIKVIKNDQKLLYWLEIDAEVQRLISEELLEQLKRDFPDLQQLLRTQRVK